MRVLFISSSRLGDAVLSMSVLHHLEKKYPNLSVTVVSGALPAPLFTNIPFCKEHYILEKKKFSRHWFDLWKYFKDESFDLVIDLRGSIVSFFFKAKKRMIWRSSILPKGHQVERFSKLLELERPSCPKLWLDPESLEKTKKHFKHEFLAVSPAANWIGKQWPSEKFNLLLKEFQKQHPSIHIILFAAPHEKEVVEKASKGLQNTQSVLTPDLRYVTAALSRAKAFVGNDSGLMHMAAALGIPSIGLFGPSDDRRYGPYGKDHTIVRKKSLKDIESLEGFSYSAPHCYMNDIQVSDVLPHLLNLWRDYHDETLHVADVTLRRKS